MCASFLASVVSRGKRRPHGIDKLSAFGATLSTVNEFSPGVANFPAKTFTLNGPKIVAVRFDSNGFGTAAFSAVLLDDLVLNYRH